MDESKSWKRINRKTVYDSKFMSLHEDMIELPNGKTIDDYSVVEFHDVVIIVATDENGNLVTMREYKYAVDETMTVLPAGTIEKGEDVLVAAKRELLEETGRVAEDVTLVGVLHEYPTKAGHDVSIVRARGARLIASTAHEETEQIDSIDLMSPLEVRRAIVRQEFKTATILGGIVLAMPELFNLDGIVVES